MSRLTDEIRWDYWRLMPEVKLWEAVALSLGLEPHSMEHSRLGWMGGRDSGPHFERTTWKSAAQAREFELRLKVLVAHICNRDYFSSGALSLVRPADHGIRLSEFANWAMRFAKWQDLPQELSSMAQAPASLLETHPSPPSRTSANDRRPTDWQEEARRIADELFDRDTQLHTRDTLDNYSKRVMLEMQKRDIHGPRGRIDNAGTIKREALQGAMWWAIKKK